MYNFFFHSPVGGYGPALGVGGLAVGLLFIVIALWSLAWKAVALWHAARNRQRIWFIVLLIVNTVGILEIIYLAWFQKDANASGAGSLFNIPDHLNPMKRAKSMMNSTSKPTTSADSLPVAESSPE